MKYLHLLAFAGAAASVPTTSTSSSKFCFLTDTSTVPANLLSALAPIADRFTCSRSPTWQPVTIPDITLTSAYASRKISFSKINYADSDQTPLSFSLGQFAPQEPLASNNLSVLKDQLYVYLAMEASVIAHGGQMTSVLPRLFLEFQVARVSRAQERGTTDADVDMLLRKLVTEADEEKEDQALIDELRDMAISNRLELRRPRVAA